MVRHKTRWLLVRLDFFEDLSGDRTWSGADTSSSSKTSGEIAQAEGLITKKDVLKSIRDSLGLSFGVASSGISNEIQVRLYDEHFRLAMIRVPREESPTVRAAVTFLRAVQGKPVVASIISVNGSARTAKAATIMEFKRSFREQMAGQRNCSGSVLKVLEERIGLIRSID